MRVAALAGRRRLAPDTIARLVGDPHPDVRRQLARRRGLRWSVIERLVADPVLVVRLTVALFQQLPAGLLERYAQSAMLCERQVAAASPRLPSTLQVALAGDRGWEVRRLLLLNAPPNQPLEVLTMLAPAHELAKDSFASGRLLECLDAHLGRAPVVDAPQALIVALMRSPSPPVRKAGRELAFAAHAARARGQESEIGTGVASDPPRRARAGAGDKSQPG